MEARKWYDAESIELNQWTSRFSKCAKYLPPSATRPIAGKSLNQVLFETSKLRHSAVHRLPTSAVGILNMVKAAICFADALNDTKRAAKVEAIKQQLASSIEDIVQHQNLLERKLSDQLEDFARRRAEIDELERLAVEDLLDNDKMLRNDVGSVVESFLARLQTVPRTCMCEPTVPFENQKAISGIEDDVGVTEKGTSPLSLLPSNRKYSL